MLYQVGDSKEAPNLIWWLIFPITPADMEKPVASSLKGVFCFLK